MDEQTANKLAKEAIKNGNWMIRRSDNGEAYGGFEWKPVGEWTVAPDWNPMAKCGGGLHGVGPKSLGWWSSGKDIDFCLTKGDIVQIDEEKIKVREAMVIMRNRLPEGLSVKGKICR
jgi:hypothetical protein